MTTWQQKIPFSFWLGEATTTELLKKREKKLFWSQSRAVLSLFLFFEWLTYQSECYMNELLGWLVNQNKMLCICWDMLKWCDFQSVFMPTLCQNQISFLYFYIKFTFFLRITLNMCVFFFIKLEAFVFLRKKTLFFWCVRRAKHTR